MPGQMLFGGLAVKQTQKPTEIGQKKPLVHLTRSISTISPKATGWGIVRVNKRGPRKPRGADRLARAELCSESLQNYLQSPPTIFWKKYTHQWTDLDPASGAYIRHTHLYGSPLLGSNALQADSIDSTLFWLQDIVARQIMFTLVTWHPHKLTGKQVQKRMGYAGSLYYQSCVSSTLNSGVLKGIYRKEGKREYAQFSASLDQGNLNYMKRFKFIPSERAIQIARRRVKIWDQAQRVGIKVEDAFTRVSWLIH